jgi:hypothetical protein
LDKRLQLDVFYAAGIKQVDYPDGARFFAHTLSFTLLKPISHKSNIGIGGDVFYDLGMHRQLAGFNIVANEVSDALRTGIHIGYELKLYKLSMLVQMGRYVYDKNNFDGFIYHRYGLKYQINSHLFANFTLKTHYAKADYAEFGVGWKFCHLPLVIGQ